MNTALSTTQDIDEEEFKKQILLRSLMGGQKNVYGKPMIGNENTAHMARAASNGLQSFFGGKPEFPASGTADDFASKIAMLNYKQSLADPIDRQIKENQLLTGSPDFKLKEAQTRADMDIQKGLDLETAKSRLENQKYQDALKNNPDAGQLTADGISEYDPKVGAFVKKPLPPSIETRKIKSTEGLYDTVNQANLNYGKVQRGIESAPKLPQGFLGNMKIKWLNFTGSKDPSLSDWQNMKSLLLDVQLQSVAKTKGAISDREMSSFATAAANDDISNVMRQQTVLDAYKKAIFSDQESKINSFKKSFNDDPRQWGDLPINPDSMKIMQSIRQSQTPPFVNGIGENQQMPEFSSEDDAEASGYKGMALVAGKRARID